MSSILHRALAHAALGMSVIPCRGKQPALLAWKQYQQRPASAVTVAQWAEAGLLTNYGVICGAVSGGLIVIDLDGLQAVGAFWDRYPRHMDTYRVATGSGKGEHVYFWADGATPTTRAMGRSGNFELRSNGAYVIGAGCTHPDTGSLYQPMGNLSMIKRLRLFEVSDIADWIRSLTPRPAQPRPVTTGIATSDKWVAAAVAGEIAAVRSAPKGGRNATLNRAAFKLGSIVATGRLARHEVEAALTAAAAELAADDGDESVARTIRSGIEAGLCNPRKVS